MKLISAAEVEYEYETQDFIFENMKSEPIIILPVTNFQKLRLFLDSQANVIFFLLQDNCGTRE